MKRRNFFQGALAGIAGMLGLPLVAKSEGGLKSEIEWIGVRDRLPEMSKEKGDKIYARYLGVRRISRMVLVCFGSGAVKRAHLCDDGIWVDSGRFVTRPTYWSELPETPQK